MMRAAIFMLVWMWAVPGFADPPGGSRNEPVAPVPQSIHAFQGSWKVRIENMDHQVITTMTLRFEDEAAKSCMSGDWKRVVVLDHHSSDEKFFPTSEPLSYGLFGDELRIGRNEICDNYLHLTGKKVGDTVTGEYDAFGLRVVAQKGFFTLTRTK